MQAEACKKGGAMPRKRTITHTLYVSDAEELIIRSNMAKLGINNFSTYARRMLTEGRIFSSNEEEEKVITKNMVNIGNNINQIARKVNINDNAGTEEINEVLAEWRKFKKYYKEMMKKYVIRSKYI